MRRLAALLVLTIACATPALAADSTAPTVLAVRINGVAVSDGATVLQAPSGAIYVSSDDLATWRLLPRGVPLALRGRTYYPLAAFPGLRYSVESTTLTLNIAAPASLFAPTAVALARSARTLQSARGSFFNYDLVASGGVDLRSSISGILDAGIFGTSGSVETTALERPSERGGAQFIRLDTALTRDYPQARASMLIGDAFTVGGTLAVPVRFAGIRYGTDFSNDPYFNPSLSPVVAGAAAAPSAVSVYVDGALAASANVPAGPFAINDLQVVNGQGELRMVVTDALGRQQIVSRPFYASPSLLKPGVSDFSFAAGVLRRNYGIESNDYGSSVVEFTDRTGMSDRFTGEVHAEWTPGVALVGAAGTWLVSRAGVFTLGTAADAGKTCGAEGIVAYEYVTRRFNVGVRDQFSSNAFAQVGGATAITGVQLRPFPLPLQLAGARRQAQASVGVDFGRNGSLGLAYAQQSDRIASRERVASANYVVRVWSGTVDLSAVRVVAPTPSTQLALSYLVALGRGATLISQASDNGIARSATAQLQQQPPQAGSGYGYRFASGSLGGAPYADAAVIAQGNATTLTLEDALIGGRNAYRAELSGSSADVDGQWFASRALGDSFGIVAVPGYAGVHVSVDGQVVGATDARGLLAIPSLRSFQDNRISISADDLPLDAQIASTTLTIAPARRSGVRAAFDVVQLRAALLVVRDDRANPLAPGTVVHRADGSGQWPIAESGEVYITGIAPGTTTYIAQLDGEPPCRFTLTAPAHLRGIAKLPPVICR